ncbi:MAG: ATP-dependent Clp protease ATP-binding subunit [Peptoanaerobacter stomatis]|uniref:ATP-dependent Clp protease ATP-binding subunit n=1 Tax=Peptoanaerobacter stomatis TaxID=796937 RepID=UPI003F9F79A1
MIKIETFTQFSRRLLNLAAQEASKLGHNTVDSEHILIAISRQEKSLVGRILSEHNLYTDDIVQKVLEKNEKGVVPSNVLIYASDIKDIFEESISIANSLSFEFVGLEHVLIAILGKKGIATDILNNSGIYRDDVIDEIIIAKKEFDNIKQKVKDISEYNEVQEDYGRNIYKKPPKISRVLNRYATDITNNAENGELNIVVEREEEIERITHILARRNKNNPVLVGEAGVGKTSVIYAIAQNIVSKKTPNILRNKRIFQLNMPLVVSGSKYKGELEERIRKIIEEVSSSENIILFIDNFHSIAILSNQENTSEAGNMIKNALAEGKLQIIGVTSASEYKRYIEKDDVIKRRIQVVQIKEPSEEKAVKMLMAVKQIYENYHDVRIEQDAIELAVKLSKRYISTMYLPDKAIDIIDEASAKLKLARDEDYYEIDEVLKNIKDAKFRIAKEVRENNIQNVSIIRDEILDLDRIMSSISDERLKIYNEKKILMKKDIECVVSAITGIPIEKLTKTQEDKLLDMRKNISKYVIGQDEAVLSVTRAIQRARTGLKDPKKPIGSFIFLGPTGVGKTQLAKTLARELFDDEDAMIRVDMSEYMEKFDVSKVIGSPPGYVGYSEGGQLTEKVKKKPYCVLLFDEIEKAHPDIFDLLLQVLDEGHLTDSQGRKVDFKNSIIIMTSNIGASAVKKQNNFGFSNQSFEKINDDVYKNLEKSFISELKKYFKPEFINRVDEIVVFRQLEKNDISKIAGIMIERLQERLKDRGIHLIIQDSAIETIAKDGYNPEYGARPLLRTIQKMLENEIAQKILLEEIKDNSFVNVIGNKDSLSFEIINEDCEE